MKETTKKTTEAVKTPSKKELFDFLKTNAVKAEGNQNLSERIAYAVKSFETDQKKVTKEDLSELAKELSSFLIDSVMKKSEESTPETEAPVKGKKSEKKPKENALKPKKKVEKKPEPEEEEDEEEEKPVKKTSKKGTVKTPAKKNEVETLPPVSNKGVDVPSATMFPKELEIEGLGKLISCAGQYETYESIKAAIDEEKSLYFACYWSKTQVKKFQYAESKMVKPETCKNGFPNDLDILNAVLTCETMERLFAMSLYTEALFQFEAEDFKAVEDTDPRSGKKFKVRVSAGMEFEIYRPADEEVAE